MEITIHKFTTNDIEDAMEIWNKVVEDGVAFPQKNTLEALEGLEFFQKQSYTGIAVDEHGKSVGLYVLYPDNVGRCGHICNGIYTVREDMRGQHIGEILVKDSMKKAKELGFQILLLDTVVATNTFAIRLYKKLGFTQLGVISKGFLMKDGTYEDIIPHYIAL